MKRLHFSLRTMDMFHGVQVSYVSPLIFRRFLDAHHRGPSCPVLACCFSAKLVRKTICARGAKNSLIQIKIKFIHTRINFIYMRARINAGGGKCAGRLSKICAKYALNMRKYAEICAKICRGRNLT